MLFLRPQLAARPLPPIVAAPSVDRPFGGTEAMIDAVDRVGTMNFVTIAHVRGTLSRQRLDAALGQLQIRHPLLACRIVRHDPGVPSFAHDPRLSIPVRVVAAASHDAWIVEAQRELNDTVWPDDAAPARLTVLEHGAERRTVLLTWNHRVSDGSSGMFAMRDLLRFAWEPSYAARPLVSAPMEDYLPEGLRGAGALVACARFWASKLAEQLRSPKPRKLRPATPSLIAARKTRVLPITLSPDATRLLAVRARQERATVHGALTAALLSALRGEMDGDGPCTLQCNHPVNLRPLLKDLGASGGDLDERIGYFVSYSETAHALTRTGTSRELWDLARDVTARLRAGRDRHDPIRAVPLVTAVTRRLAESGPSPRALRLVDGLLMHDSVVLTNLGRLEIEESFAGGVVEALHFVAASSFIAPCIASVATFKGELRMNLCYQEPTLTRAVAEGIACRAEAVLTVLSRRESP